MIKKALFLFYALISNIICAQPTLTKDWDYKEPIARGSFVTRDNAGNIITIGLGGTNMFGTYVRLIVIKQDTAGNLIWKKVLGDVAGGLLRAKDFVIDSANNIYITGRAHYNAQNAEGFTLKYDASGNLVWRKYYGSAIGLVGEFNSITIYDNKYVYVTGEMDSINGQGARKAVLAKYDSIGNLLWNKADSVGYNQEGKSIEVDNAGNAYMIGYTSCCLPGGKMFVEKYDSSGRKQWKTVIIDTAYQYGYPFCSVIDDSANVYLGGEIQGLHVSTGFDGGLTKVDSSGIMRWFTPYVSSSSNQIWEKHIGLNIDKNFNCYIHGYSFNTSNNGYGYIIRVNSNGILQWDLLGNALFPNSSYFIINSILVNDNMIIAGGIGLTQNSSLDFLTLMLDTSGNVKSKLLYNSPYNCSANSFAAKDTVSCFFTGQISDLNHVVQDSLFVLKLNINSATSVKSTYKKQLHGINFYPLPFNDILNIVSETQELPPCSISLFNYNGARVYTINTELKLGNILLDLAFIPSGIYMLELNFGKENIIRTKLVKSSNP